VRVYVRNSDEKIEQQNPPSAKRILSRVSRYFFPHGILHSIDRCNCKQRDLASSRCWTCVEIYFGEIFDFFSFFFFQKFSWRKSCVFTENFRRKVDLLCVWFIRYRARGCSGWVFNDV